MPVSFYFFSHTMPVLYFLRFQFYTTLRRHYTDPPISHPTWQSRWTRMSQNTSTFEHSFYIGNYLGAILYGVLYYTGRWAKRWRTGTQVLNWPFITWFCGAFFDGGTETLPEVDDSAPFIVQWWFYCPLSMFPAMQFGGSRCGSHIVTILVVCRDTSRLKFQYGTKL